MKPSALRKVLTLLAEKRHKMCFLKTDFQWTVGQNRNSPWTYWLSLAVFLVLFCWSAFWFWSLSNFGSITTTIQDKSKSWRIGRPTPIIPNKIHCTNLALQHIPWRLEHRWSPLHKARSVHMPEILPIKLCIETSRFSFYKFQKRGSRVSKN